MTSEITASERKTSDDFALPGDGSGNQNMLRHAYKILDNLNASMFVGLLTLDGVLLYANRAALSAIGVSLNAVAGKPFGATPWWGFSDELRQKLRGAIGSAAEGVTSRFDHYFINTENQLMTIDFTLIPILDRDGTVAYLVASGNDVTEQRRAEREILVSRSIFSNAKIPLLRIRADGYINAANEAACMLFGRDRHNLVRQPVAVLANIPDRIDWPPLWEQLKTSGKLLFEATYVRSDGHTIPFEISATRIEEGGKEMAFAIITDLSEKKKAEQYIHFLTHYDALTGLPNRRSFVDIIDHHIALASALDRKIEGKFAVIIADVERFWMINDTLGRDAGDQLLKQTAERLQQYIRGQNRLARVGADHFALVVEDVKTEKEVRIRVENKLRDCFIDPFIIGDAELRVSAKFGVSVFPEDGINAESLIKRAELALIEAKASSDRYLLYTPGMAGRTAGKLDIENKLRQALKNGEFVLFYQPKICMATGKVAGVEALIRWNNAELGQVSPIQFIGMLEETGMILEVGTWVLNKAAEVHQSWRRQGLPAPRIAVNISAMQLHRPDFVHTVRQALQHEGTSFGIDLEITESVIMEDLTRNSEKLSEIQAMGVKIFIDDFGTGYSSLRYLAKLPAQSLKIDPSFIAEMLTNTSTRTLVSAIISLAHSLGLLVVAEGVETIEQQEMLRSMECDQTQGYLISKPLSADELVRFLNQHAQCSAA